LAFSARKWRFFQEKIIHAGQEIKNTTNLNCFKQTHIIHEIGLEMKMDHSLSFSLYSKNDYFFQADLMNRFCLLCKK